MEATRKIINALVKGLDANEIGVVMEELDKSGRPLYGDMVFTFSSYDSDEKHEPLMLGSDLQITIFPGGNSHPAPTPVLYTIDPKNLKKSIADIVKITRAWEAGLISKDCGKGGEDARKILEGT